MKFRTHQAVAILALMVGLASPVLAVDHDFTVVVAAHFDLWDADNDGELSPAELDSLTIDPTIVGEEAAAIASIKLTVRSGKYELPKVLTLDYLTTQPDKKRSPTTTAKAPVVDTDRQDDADAPTPTTNAVPKLLDPPFRAKYVSAVKKLRSTPRDLFGDETPDLGQAHQGPLGDCFFVSIVGAYVERDSQSVKRMITPKEGGGYTVAFGNGKTQDVTPLTDVELAISSRTGKDGLWLSVLEKGFGQLRMDGKPAAQRTEQSIDAISKGGSVTTSIKTLTGHDVDSVAMRAKAEKSSEEEIQQLCKRVRETLKATLDARRLASASTGSTDKVPPGMSAKHAYAVLAFDEAKDMVNIWNPHGNTFRPKGESNIEHGYVTKAGRFDVPLAEYVKIFRSTTIETDRPIPPPGRPKRPDPKQ